MTRDEHHHTGDGSHMDSLNDSIDALISKLEQVPKGLYQRLYKKDHIVMAPMYKGCCAVCGMRLPISQVQQVRLAKTIQTCSSCGRMLYNYEEDDGAVAGPDTTKRGEPRKTGISRFSAEELMIAGLKSTTAEGAIRELAEAMAANRFATNVDSLVSAAMERESVLSTAMENGLAFPHVRGVEGGGLTLAIGVSKDGIEYDDSGEKVHIIFFSVIPIAVSAFYLRLMASLSDAFSKKTNRDSLLDAKDSASLWKSLIKATNKTIR